MKNIKNLALLKEIGLTDEEAAVYLAGLSLGKTTILKLARATEIKRSNVYRIVETLKNRGLMSMGLAGLKNVYIAESPEKLEIMLERRTKELKSQLPELLGLYNLKGSESLIKYYTGVEAMKQLYRETLRDIKSGEDYLVITNQEKWHAIDPSFAQSYIEDRAKLNIKTRLLFQDSPIAREHKKFERNFNEEVRILPERTALNVDTILMPNKLIVLDLGEPYMTVVIENKSIVDLHKEMFELVWKSTPKDSPAT